MRRWARSLFSTKASSAERPNFAWNAVDIPRTARWDEQNMAEHVTLNGLENIERWSETTETYQDLTFNGRGNTGGAL